MANVTRGLPASKILDILESSCVRGRIFREIEVEDLAASSLIEERRRAMLELAEHGGFPMARAWAQSQPTICFTRRIDGLLMLDNGERVAIEVKRSRLDFRNDTPQKRDPWRRHVHRFVYACTPSLIRPTEVPDGCGLVYVDDEGPEKIVGARNISPLDLPNGVTSQLRQLGWEFI